MDPIRINVGRTQVPADQVKRLDPQAAVAQPESTEPTSELRRMVKSWMTLELSENPHDYDDCNEVDATKLGEEAADQLDLYTDDEGTIPEWVWDLAADVALAKERRL